MESGALEEKGLNAKGSKERLCSSLPCAQGLTEWGFRHSCVVSFRVTCTKSLVLFPVLNQKTIEFLDVLSEPLTGSTWLVDPHRLSSIFILNM